MASNRYYNGPRSDHFDGERFFNPNGVAPLGLRHLLKWQLATPKATWPKAFPSPQRDQPPSRVAGDGVRVGFIGHASFLVQGGGRSILIDPVFAERASPTQLVGPKRVNPPGIAFAALPTIDAVIVTHNHYDHMDMTTLTALWQRDRPRFVTPLGNDTILKRGIGDAIDVVAMDWGGAHDLGGARVHCVPTQHWSARGMGDRMAALWASFVIEAGGRTIYAVGDSGFGDGAIFRDVGARFPAIDLALLPIGAYEPRWFMVGSHMNPDDAVQALLTSGARRAVGHHWGTFQLTNEAIEAPAEALGVALTRQSVEAERFWAVRPGQVVEV